MNVLYEEEGAIKVGAVLADNVTSLQVEAPHGKRSKIKAAQVLLRFTDPGIVDFMPQAQRLADEIELDFLWECSTGDEFGFEDVAREYYGHPPGPLEAAAVLLRVHGAPMYFYKRGRGRYKAAPPDALKAALASVERKRIEAERKDVCVAELKAGALPEAFRPVLSQLLYKPDRNSIEWKALEEASVALKASPTRVIERCGGITSTHDYHLQRFLFEWFPRGTGFPETALTLEETAELPLSDARAFSIDDAATTEIDDAFSVTMLANGNVRFGIHIAAPALGVPAGSAADEAARGRLSTVYFPGSKITMLPDPVIARYTLAAASACPALSLYAEVTPAFETVARETRVERVNIAENLRHDTLEPLFNEATLGEGRIAHPEGFALTTLWGWAQTLEEIRRAGAAEMDQRPEFVFRVTNDRVHIARRARGTPLDKLVSELMIYVNSAWGGDLAASAIPAIYRVQGGGKVRMSTVPSGHAGLGVEQYVWASSPLRRYTDLVNQRQIVALARGEPPPYQLGDPRLGAIMSEFESAYEAYNEFQRTMERYWSLRWLLQEKVETVEATVLRESLCRFEDLPLVARVPSLPAAQPGARVTLEVGDIDLLDLTFRCEYRGFVSADVPFAAA
jgi:exoribonuclease-2